MREELKCPFDEESKESVRKQKLRSKVESVSSKEKGINLAYGCEDSCDDVISLGSSNQLQLKDEDEDCDFMDIPSIKEGFLIKKIKRHRIISNRHTLPAQSIGPRLLFWISIEGNQSALDCYEQESEARSPSPSRLSKPLEEHKDSGSSSKSRRAYKSKTDEMQPVHRLSA